MASKVFPAAFNSDCGECLDQIEEGDPIRMVDGEAVHEDCYDPANDDDTFGLDVSTWEAEGGS